MKRMIATMAVLGVLSAPPTFAAGVDEVHQMLDAIEQAWSSHNLDALTEYSHPGLLAVISRPDTPDGALVLRRDQVMAQIAKNWGNVVSHQFVEREIQIQNGIAWMQLTVADRMADRSNRLAHVLNAAVKVGPAWKVCFSMPRLFQAVQVVEDLPSDSPAGGAALRPGDVIVTVGGRPPPAAAPDGQTPSVPSGPQDVVVRRKSEEMCIRVSQWPGGARISERLAPFGSAVIADTDASHPAQNKSVDAFRGYVTGDLDRALEPICPAGYLSFRVAGRQGPAVPVDAGELRALLDENLRQMRKTCDLATMRMTELRAIAIDDVAIVGGVVTASTRGADARTVSSPAAVELWVRQGRDWFLAATLRLALRIGLDTSAKGPTVDAKAVEQRIAGKMVGIGVSLEKVEAGLRIKEVFPGAPADRGGLHSGDIITAVEGRPAKGLSVSEAVSRITGPEGTEVGITVQTPDGGARTAKLTREAFQPVPVSGRLLEDGVALVTVPLFYNDAPQDFRQQVEALRGRGATGLVLDLRNCDGGTPGSARSIAEMFVPAGQTLWIVQTEKGAEPVISRKTRQIDLPVVVLAGPKTGGAAELVVSALKQNNRAIILGGATAGLARLRQVQDRPDGQKELVDIGTFLAAPNVPITGSGVQPGVRVPADAAEAEVLRRAAGVLASAGKTPALADATASSGGTTPAPQGVESPADASAVRTVPVGTSVGGEPLVLEVFGTGPHPIFIVGGIHGNEPVSAQIAKRLAAYLRDHSSAVRGTTVGILAAANPDGLATGTRGNNHGVDLNRNFPTKDWQANRIGKDEGGPKPASEPETQAILAAIEHLRPERVISIHVWMPAGPPQNNYDGPAEEMAKLMAARNGYKVTGAVTFPTPGSLGTWAGVDHHIPIVTLELPKKPAGLCWDENRDALLAAIAAPAVSEKNAAATAPSPESRAQGSRP